MKAILTLAILLMIFLIGCNIEQNATLKVQDYSNSIVLLPFLLMTVYARVNYSEFKEFITKYQ